MKLLTEMHKGRVRFIDPRNTVELTYQDDMAWQRAIDHDAAAAHALMQAIEEFTNINVLQAYYASTWINQRADEIMAEWGFDTPPERPE